MPIFIMLTRLTPDGVKTIKDNPARVHEVNKEVEQLGVKVAQPVGDARASTTSSASSRRPTRRRWPRSRSSWARAGTIMNETLTAIDAEEFTSSSSERHA